MSLNDIKLAPLLIAKLYENILVQNDENISPISHKEVAKDDNLSNEKNDGEKILNLKYLGKNAKHILIIINEPEHAFLGDEELTFLMNILNACQITMQDVALVNAYNNEGAIHQNLQNQFTPNVLLFLGTAPQMLEYPIQIPLYKIQKYNHQQYLCAPSLQALLNDKEEKKNLWTQLKVLFGV